MKKILVSMFLLVFALVLVGCESSLIDEGVYKLTVIDDFGYLVKPLDKYYKAGEEVEVHLAFLSGPAVGININGEYIGEDAETKHVDGHPVISFIMPYMDSILYTTMNGRILKDCGDDNHKWDDGIIIESDDNVFIERFFCELCGKSKDVYGTVIPPLNKILTSFLTLINPNFVYLYSDINNIEKMSRYSSFKEQEFFNNFSYIEITPLEDMVEYDISQVDYYLKFINNQTNDFLTLEFFNVIDNNNDYYYGWLKTSDLNGIFEFKIERILFTEIYDYFINDTKQINYYARENGNYIAISNYSCQKIINIILESEEITYEQSKIGNLNLDLLITTYKPTSYLNPLEIKEYNYEWRLDYETGISEVVIHAPAISSIAWMNRYFKVSLEAVMKIKNILSNQPYELINDFELLSFYSDTMLISNVEGFPLICITQDVGTTSRFARVHKRYNEEFFNEYALMIIKFETNSTTDINGIEDIKFDGDKFTVLFDVNLGFTDDYVVKYYVLKIKKSTLPILEKSIYDVEVKV